MVRHGNATAEDESALYRLCKRSGIYLFLFIFLLVVLVWDLKTSSDLSEFVHDDHEDYWENMNTSKLAKWFSPLDLCMLQIDQPNTDIKAYRQKNCSNLPDGNGVDSQRLFCGIGSSLGKPCIPPLSTKTYFTSSLLGALGEPENGLLKTCLRRVAAKQKAVVFVGDALSKQNQEALVCEMMRTDRIIVTGRYTHPLTLQPSHSPSLSSSHTPSTTLTCPITPLSLLPPPTSLHGDPDATLSQFNIKWKDEADLSLDVYFMHVTHVYPGSHNGRRQRQLRENIGSSSDSSLRGDARGNINRPVPSIHHRDRQRRLADEVGGEEEEEDKEAEKTGDKEENRGDDGKDQEGSSNKKTSGTTNAADTEKDTSSGQQKKSAKKGDNDEDEPSSSAARDEPVRGDGDQEEKNDDSAQKPSKAKPASSRSEEKENEEDAEKDSEKDEDKKEKDSEKTTPKKKSSGASALDDDAQEMVAKTPTLQVGCDIE